MITLQPGEGTDRIKHSSLPRLVRLTTSIAAWQNSLANAKDRYEYHKDGSDLKRHAAEDAKFADRQIVKLQALLAKETAGGEKERR